MAAITKFSQLDLSKKYSYADYLTWQFKERVELFKGKIFKMSPAPNRIHQTIMRRITSEFEVFFEEHPCHLYFAPFDVMLTKKDKKDKQIFTVVQPDLVVVCDETKLDEQGCKGSPDLVVEVLSPGNSKKEMTNKFKLYEENEIPEYWIIDPERKTALVYYLKDGIYIGMKPFTEDEVIISKKFPKLKVRMEKLF